MYIGTYDCSCICESMSVICGIESRVLFGNCTQEHSVTSHLLSLCRLNDVLEFAEDYECDIPKFWDYIAELLSPSVAHKGFPLATLKQAHEGPLESGKIGKLVAKILHRCISLEVSKVADDLSSLSHAT